MSRRPPKQRHMTNLLLKGIRASGKSLSFLWSKTRIGDYRLRQFVKGKGTLRLATADRLVNALDLKVSARVKAPHK